MRRPSFQFYPGDWRKDVELRSCSLRARGLWIELLCIAHECEPYGHLTVNGRAMTVVQIAGQVGISAKECQILLDELLDNGVARKTSEGVVYSNRMVNDEYIRNVRAASGRLGGNPNLVNQTSNQSFNHLVNQTSNQSFNQAPKRDPTPSSSSSSSSSLTTSEPIGSATASAAAHGALGAGMTAQEAVWADGVPLLMAAGLPEQRVRSFLGQKVKAHGVQAVQDVILRCAEHQPVEPVAWMTAALGKAPERSSAQTAPVAWWVDAGFADRYQAENAGCTEHSAHRWRDGKREEMRA